MKVHIGAAAALLVALGPRIALAEPLAASISLEQAIRVAVENSPTLAGAVIDVRQAEAHVLQASGLDDFVVGSTGSWVRTRGPNVDGQTSTLLPYDAVDVNATLTRPLPTGGDVAVVLDLPLIRGASPLRGGGQGLVPVQAYAPSAQLSITQPLLRGRGFDVARAPLRQARANLETAKWDLATGATALLRDVAISYWELAYAGGEVELRSAALAAAEEQLAAVRAQIGVGKQPPSGAAEVEVSVALRHDELIDSDRILARRVAELKLVLGISDANALPDLRASDAPPAGVVVDDHVFERALARSPELRSLRAQRTAAAIQVDVSRNTLLPRFDVFASAGPLGVAGDISPALRVLSSFGGFTSQVGFVFEEPVERRAQRGARDAAVNGVERARAIEAEGRVRLASAISTALASLKAARERGDLLANAVSVAEVDLDAERARFQAGRSTNFDVLRRQQSLTAVRLRLLRARMDDAEALATLDSLTGDILARNRLALRETGDFQ